MDLSEFEGKLEVSDLAKSYLSETAKWAKFLAIVGFVSVGLIAIIAFFIGTIFSTISALAPTPTPFPAQSMGIGMTIFYLAIAVLYFFPCLYLYKFATKTKVALANDDSDVLTEALENHKSMFKFMGIMTAIMVGMYALIFVFAAIAGGFAAFMR